MTQRSEVRCGMTSNLGKRRADLGIPRVPYPSDCKYQSVRQHRFTGNRDAIHAVVHKGYILNALLDEILRCAQRMSYAVPTLETAMSRVPQRKATKQVKSHRSGEVRTRPSFHS